MNNKKILLTNADYLATLEIARRLGRRGIKILVADNKKYRIAKFSRFVTPLSSPSINESDRFIDWLIEKAKERVFDTIIPTSDLMVWYLSSRYKRLSKFVRLLIPNQNAVNIAMFKDRLHKFCIQNSLATPITKFPISMHEVEKLSLTLHYPVIIKHRTQIGINVINKGTLVHSSKDLIRHYKKDHVIFDRKEILQASPNVEWPMLQQYINCRRTDLVSVVGFASDNGNTMQTICCKKVRQEPPRLGISTCVYPIKNKEITNIARKYVKASKINGPFHIEFIYDLNDGKNKIIDVNLRMSALLQLATANGLNLPDIWYNQFMIKSNMKSMEFYGTKVFIHGLSDLYFLIGNIYYSNNQLREIKEIISSYSSPHQFAVFSIDDIKPFILEFFLQAKINLAHPRRYLNQLIKGE